MNSMSTVLNLKLFQIPFVPVNFLFDIEEKLTTLKDLGKTCNKDPIKKWTKKGQDHIILFNLSPTISSIFIAF